MKVLFSVPRYHPNHDGMVRGLIGGGHSVAFLVLAAHPTEHYAEGVEVTRVQFSRRLAFLNRPGRRTGTQQYARLTPSWPFLYGYLRTTRPDIIVAREMSWANYALFILSRLLGIKFILYTQSQAGYENLPSSRRRKLRLGLWPRHTLNTVAREPAHDIPGKTYDFIPFAVETDTFRKQAYPTGLPLRLLATGKLDQERKNHVPLVRSLAPLMRAGKVRLTILGLVGPPFGPAFRRLLDEIETQSVGDFVRIVKNLPYQESRQLYEQHDLFVLVSSREAAGISPVEAMATGLPVIVGSDNGTNYFIEVGRDGLIFEDQDFDDFIRKVEHFTDDPAEIERMGRNARDKIAAEYGPASFEGRFVDIVTRRFPDLIEGCSGGRRARIQRLSTGRGDGQFLH